MLLFLATCYCCITHQLFWFYLCMYRAIFTVAVTMTRHSSTLADALTDYSYINAQGGHSNGFPVLARCMTGLGPNDTSYDSNGALGGWYFNGNMIPNSGESASYSSDVIQVRSEAVTAGVINIRQCGAFSTTVEGVYTCTMMNSSMMYQSVRFRVYFGGRSESLDYTYVYLIT